MALVKGMGTCLIPTEEGAPCGKQIQEGEAISTVVSGFNSKMPLTGHKKCADAFHYRIQQSERAKREDLVKRMNQQGPGGAVDPTTAEDVLEGGSIPLVKEEPVAPQIQTITSGLPPGTSFLGDLPEDVSPDDAVKIANGDLAIPITYQDPVAELNVERMKSFPGQVTPAKNTYLQGLVADSIPTVDAVDGRVTLTSGTNVLRLDPEDAEDLTSLITINANRAKRQLGQ